MTGKLVDSWLRLPIAARIGLAAASIVVAGLAIVAAAWALRTDYRPLFTDLDPRDAAAITAELDRMKVPYVVGEDGVSILVERSAVHGTRLKIMGKGLDLKGTVGFEIFNNTDFGMTEFAQKINYQRALQGELARTIGAIEEVKSARVHLVLPESGLLRRAAVKPKASVSLVMRGAERLQAEQIQGIQRLVAAAVAELEPAAVTVLDQQGVALSPRADGGAEGQAAGARLEAKRDVEAYLTRKVLAVLDQAFGPGKAIVSIDVTLDLDQVKVTREDVLPGGAGAGGLVARRRETTQRSGDAPRAVTAAADGVREVARGASSTTAEVEYQHGRKVEQIVSAPGSIRRVSVGVLLPQSIEPYQRESLRQVIGMAVGLDPSRGDAIAFSWVRGEVPSAQGAGGSLAGKPEPAHRMASDATSIRPQMVWTAAGTAALALLAGLALLLVRRGRRADAAPALTPEERDEILAQLKSWIALGATARSGAAAR